MPDFVIRPTMKFIKLAYTLVFVVVAAALAAANNLGWPLWTAAAAAVLLLWPAARHLRRQFTKMSVTGDKLRYESGFLSKTTRTLQLSKVQDVSVDQSLSQRMFGVGDLSIETAGETSRLTVANIDGPQAIADHVMEASAHGGARPPAARNA